jgi:hypothetical protein
MAADALGNDVAAVGIPVTGFLGFAPLGTAIPTPAAGALTPLVLDPAFKKVGLLTEDGGFAWTLEPDGDPISFWQDGYTIPSGLANVTLVAKVAQYNEIIRGLLYGRTPDGNGYITIDGGGSTNRYVLFSEEIFKNGAIRRRVAADASVSAIALDQSTRGEVNGTEVTFTVARNAAFGNDHIGEWLLPAGGVVIPIVTAATPASQGAGQVVTITGSGFLGATQVRFGATNAAMYVVDSATQIRATLPVGSAGTANITVINSAGTSNAFAYTRVV